MRLETLALHVIREREQKGHRGMLIKYFVTMRGTARWSTRDPHEEAAHESIG